MPRVSRPVAERILDGDVSRGPLVAEDEVLAEETRDGRDPCDFRVVRGVVYEQGQSGGRHGVGGAPGIE